MSSIDFNNCYPGMVQDDETCFRFTDKSVQENERTIYDNAWREEINKYGIQVNYYVNTFTTLSADNIYGEQTTQVFSEPRTIKIGAELNDDAVTLSRFGYESDDLISAMIHIKTFETVFGSLRSVYNKQNSLIEPKAGDVFQLTEYGDDRPGGRQAKYFEITERLDQAIAEINQLQGHFVFRIKAKRLDYSYEPGIPFNSVVDGVSGNQQIYEDTFTGRLSGGTHPETEGKKENYGQYDADKNSFNIFDMDSEDRGDQYGRY
jgi:hypothetical protein